MSHGAPQFEKVDTSRPLSSDEEVLLSVVDAWIEKADTLIEKHRGDKEAVLADSEIVECFNVLSRLQDISLEKVRADFGFDDNIPAIIERVKKHGYPYIGMRKPHGFYSDEIMELVDTLNKAKIRLQDIGDHILKCDSMQLMNRLSAYRRKNNLPPGRLRRSKNRPYIA